MRPLVFHLPLIGMSSILAVLGLIDAGRLPWLRNESTFGWMVVVWYPLVALLGLTQVVLWIRWSFKHGMPSWIRSRRARRIAFAGVLILATCTAILLAFRMAHRWGVLE